MSIRTIAALSLLAMPLTAVSCLYFDPGNPNEPVDAAPGDGNPVITDADPDLSDAGCRPWSYTPNYFDPCALVAPAGPLILSAGSYHYDTDIGSLEGPNGSVPHASQTLALDPSVRVIAVGRLHVEAGATLRVVGSMPLVVAAWNGIRVDGVIDVSSVQGEPGAGANPNACAATAPRPGQTAEVGGGGGGGGFGASGGEGGDGASLDGGEGGARGTPVPVPLGIRGGCSGARGGGGDRQDGGGIGGPGGGAVYLAADVGIEIAGSVHAGGAGGGGATANIGGTSQSRRSGGGGGGSGGFLALEAPEVSLTATAILAANGGGGGGGVNNGVASDGESGQAAAVAASGGNSAGGAADGAPGGYRDSENGGPGPDGNDDDAAGGGGGGGVGYIITYGTGLLYQGAVVSPAITVEP